MGIDRRDRSASLDSLGRRKRRSDRPRGRADSSASSSSSRGSRSPSRSRYSGSRSSRHRSSRHRSRSRSRERGRDRGDREGRGHRDDRRRRSNSRGRSRSWSPKQRHPRSRSRSEELNRGGKDQRPAKPHTNDAREDHSGTHEGQIEAAAPAVEAPASQLSEEEQMRMMLGFGGFDSTKGKAVDDNLQGAALGAARKEAKREYRQYMNRRGGFNRPLDQK